VFVLFGGKVLTLLPKGCVCVVWRQGFNLALDEVETSLPREFVTRLKVRFLGVCLTRLKPRFLGVCLTRLKPRFLGVLFGGEVLTLPCIANHAKIKHEKI